MLDLRLGGGGLTRRHVLRVGSLGLAGLTLADRLRFRASASDPGPKPAPDTAVILLWLSGGPSHLDTYDPKPDAPAEYRGEFRAIETAVPGVRVAEHLPLQAHLMDRISIVRSAAHTNGGHGMGAHWMMTGYVPSVETSDNLNPSCGSVAARLRGARKPGLPPYVCLPDRGPCTNAAYLGVAYNPFAPGGDPNDEGFEVRNLKPSPRVDADRLAGRRGLLGDLDTLRRDVDIRGAAEGYDRFYRDAMEIVTGPACRAAFAIEKEDPRLRDLYGRNVVGQSALLARRLVEAGATFVSITSDGWDTHANNFQELRGNLLPRYDRAVSALVQDLHGRGLDRKVLVVAMGEFGRTPKVNDQAGRDHWPGAMSVLFAGGGLKMGQVVGATDARGEAPATKPLTPQDVLATVYYTLGIDYRREFHDGGSRPIAILNEGRPIRELI